MLRKHFALPSLWALGALLVAFWWGGVNAFLLATVLVILEVTLSFDNAVVNAKVLERMSPLWQRRFLTWGMIVAVFGTRIVLPVIIVAMTAWESPLLIARLALSDPSAYATLLNEAHYAIGAFGGIFLAMVALKYFFDEAKSVHWIRVVERHLARWGRIEAIEILLGLLIIIGISFIVPDIARGTVLLSGIVGIALFIAMEAIAGAFDVEATSAHASGFALFAYLNVLDSAFSLDGVIGAFALTTDLVVIAVGLGVGAYFVRSMTIYLVAQGTLKTIKYLEHGAHWAILGLALVMLVGLVFHVPEIVTGTIGLAFVVAAYWSSLRKTT